MFATSGLPAYAELQCVSNFSFLCGASHPEELVARGVVERPARLAIGQRGPGQQVQLLAQDRATTALLLAHLAEVDARRLLLVTPQIG